LFRISCFEFRVLKTSKDPRHQRRIKIIKDLYQFSFQKKSSYKPAKKIIKNLEKIDRAIQKAARQWPIRKLNKIDLAILRLSVFELKIEKKAPPKVVIDEAVELAKTFGSNKSAKFVNGVLGFLLKSH